jgi:hypothetical protein
LRSGAAERNSGAVRSLVPSLLVLARPGSLALCLVALAGCGRPATQQECDEIVGRIAELSLREGSAPSDKGEVQKQVQETKQAFQKKTKEECVGKRITTRALGCVRNAKTAEEIVHECLN